MPAVIFDCDGVLADTERFGHLPAFNQTFQEFGLPVRWSEEEYGEKVRIGGGKERMRSLLTPDFVEEAGLPTGAEALGEVVARWHRRKTEIYVGIIASGAIPPRPGIHRIIEEAAAAGWILAVASTSAEESVRSVLERAAGADLAQRFGVYAGDVVQHKKPAPDIYELAVAGLHADRDRTIVIEDSSNGLLAARAAGLTCAVTVSGYTRDEDFTDAALVVSSLGDPGTDTEVIADPFGLAPRPFVRLADLDALLSTAGSPA
ncbi:HAD-IA family hydrolase [Kribbella amoyensis]|uniref:HAD-IA family hydrolase n=1 Tax=Kribbella amoyensis TaxID=996641 RepID=UPI0011AA4D35|nr:HAD-IA family hydrolase [Kribbella amoyensis]